MSTDERALIFQWRAAVCSESGPPSTTRLVLLVLSNHMKADGSSCFPSQATIAEESGLTTKAVKEHLKAAARAGWIRRSERSRGWKASFRYGTLYTPTFPEIAEASTRGQKSGIGEPRSPNMGNDIPKLGNVKPDLGNDVPTSASRSASRSSSGRAPGAAPPQPPGGDGAQVGAIDRYIARKKQPAGRSPNLRGGDEGAPREAPSTEQPLSEADVRKGLQALLTADASSSDRSARSLVTALYAFQDGDLAATIFNEIKRLGLSGDAARMFLVEQRDRHKAREKEDLRLDARLAKRMAWALGVPVDRFGGLLEIRSMRELDGRTREDAWSLFRWAIEDPALRKQAAAPALLRHYWTSLEEIRRKAVRAAGAGPAIRKEVSQGGSRC